ncbi:hypothetical protein Sste5344_006374 [Sporothrix stenoceras]
MAGRAAARKVVERMGRQNGYIPPELLERMKEQFPDDYDKFVGPVESLKNLAAASVKTLAQNLYSSSAKFVFELLQNYDDNQYTSLSADRSPSVSFHIYSDRIIASCNEDGFTEANVTAICSVGQSSKKNGGHGSSGADGMGYTGEKGIGFKSVFMAAEDVHIQSGDYSFRFQYGKGDSGLGMTTPIWTDTDESLEDNESHITLTLRRDGTPDEIERRRAIIREQFLTIHDSILLFMRKLEHIEVLFYDDDDDDIIKSSTSYHVERQPNNRTTVKKCTMTFDEEGNVLDTTETVKHYIMIKHVVPNLAPNDNRTDLDGTSRSDGVVVLGFPITAQSVPVLKNEYLFAFLPVKQMGFKFLIHADFVTQANREDIVTTSERNQGLADGIADAFIKAVLWFRDHQELQYTWMRYLPHDQEYPWGSFWQGVISNIRDRLARTPIMRPLDQGRPHRLICDSRRLPNSMLDQDGEPLIKDVVLGRYTSRRYISKQYKRKDLLLLGDYGLAEMSIDEWLVRVAMDVTSTDSAIKSFLSESHQEKQDWGKRVADLLVTACNSAQLSARVRELQVIPLRNKTWISVDPARPVYYPHVKTNNPNMDLDIPPMLDFDVIEASAVANSSWKHLFDKLGVKTASTAVVRDAIVSRHSQKFKGGFMISGFVAHIRFLYQTHHTTQPPYSYKGLFVICDEQNIARLCSTADYYISDQSPYGVGLLLPAEGGTLASEYGHTLHEMYMANVPSLPTPQSLSWKEWLYTFIGVRRHLRLVDKDGKSLSTICRYIAEHRPEKFVGFLQAIWGKEMLSAATKKIAIEQLSRIEVLCRDGSKASLSSTYLPLDGLEKIARRFMADEFFPWLQLEVDINEFQTFPTEWLPLDEAFNLGHRCSPVTFLLDILQHIAKGNVDAASVNNPERIYSLYVRLQSEVGASASPEEELKLEKQIRDCFTSQKLIYLPARGTIEARWADPNGCVTESLVDFLHKASLFLICEKHFPKVYSRDGSSLKTFFAKTLDINPFSWSDVINEVIFLKEARADIDMLRSLYTSIQDRQKSNHKKDPVEAQKNYGRLRDKFTDNALILGFQNNNVAGSGGGDANWNTPAQCLWTTSETQIPGRLSLNNLYPDLYDFFVKGLGVETMTIKMVYDKLVGAPMTIEETKQTIRSFSAMLGGAKDDAPKKLDVTALLAKQIFPVRMPTNRGGGVKLCKGTDDFALVDRESLAEAFAGQAKLLNFDLETTRQLQPFLKWAGLRARGLSNLVEEISCVAGDDKQIISSRDRNIRYKARALLSIAHAFDSPRLGSSPEHLYCLILCADTYLTDRITSELRLQQDGQTIKVEQAAASFHFAESPNGLQIHVRRDEVSQEMCFNGTLAKRICKWLMTDQRKNICEEISSKMVQAVQAVLSSKKTAMKGILDLHGVRFLDVPDGQKADDFTDEEDEDVEGDEDDYEDEDVEGDEDDYEDDDTPNSEHDNTLDSIDVDAGEDLYITSMMARSSISGTRVAPLPENYVPGVFGSRVVSVAADTYATDYTDLLNLVVQAAQQASIPMYGATQRSAILENTDTSFRIRRWLQHAAALEKFQQIGAAGELFSTIRRYARGHASYADMPDWTGRETADITYADTDGVLTQLLIEKGYLSSEGWSGARPQYFIEVKATVSANIETPFFMSGGQYERMQNLSDNEGGGSHENVYMIVRVFGLGSGFVGYKILVDPEKMRRRGELAFTTPEKWSVVVR